MKTLAHWRAILAGRRALLARARLQAAYWRRRKAKAKRGTPAFSHAAELLADRERKVARRKAQVAYAERVVARHTPKPQGSHLSARGLALIASFEGERLQAYHLPGEAHWTIGYGHFGADVKPGQRITHAQAIALLQRDVAWAERAVRALGLHLTPGQFDALVSIAFNCGPGILAPGTSLGAALRRHDMAAAARALCLYVHGSNGAKLPGLVRRREAERRLFVS